MCSTRLWSASSSPWWAPLWPRWPATRPAPTSWCRSCPRCPCPSAPTPCISWWPARYLIKLLTTEYRLMNDCEGLCELRLHAACGHGPQRHRVQRQQHEDLGHDEDRLLHEYHLYLHNMVKDHNIRSPCFDFVLPGAQWTPTAQHCLVSRISPPGLTPATASTAASGASTCQQRHYNHSSHQLCPAPWLTEPNWVNSQQKVFQSWQTLCK